MGVLHSFAWNYVKYANMNGFCRDSHMVTWFISHEPIGFTIFFFTKTIWEAQGLMDVI